MAQSKFAKLENKLSKRKGVTSPGGLARYIGEKKYGKKGFAAKQRAGVVKAKNAH